jgi:quercetin dioxygenase-like cupin family protein
MKGFILLAALALALLPSARTAARSDEHRPNAEQAMLFSPQEMAWKSGPASIPRGAQVAVLEGDPTEEGPFTMRLKLPDGYRIPPHTHPKTERLTVISGTFNFGTGEKFEEKALRLMPAGSYGFCPAGMKHFVQARGETVVQPHGIGPWQIVYLDPADDPRNQAGRGAGVEAIPGSVGSSGPKPGERVESFRAVALSGQFRGKQLSFVEAFGNVPVVLAFSKDSKEGTAALGVRLQRLQDRYGAKGLRTCLVYLEGPGATEMLERLVTEEGLTLPVSLLPNGRDQKDVAPYRLPPNARNTVILYRRQQVRQTFVNLDEQTFPELAAAAEKVVNEASRLPSATR